MAVDITDAILKAGQGGISSDLIFASLPCGHEREASIIYVDVGERRHGDKWKVLRREFEVECAECGAKARLNVSAV